MDKPETTNPFHQGYKARMMEMTEDSNPYLQPSPERTAWMRGWDEAEDDWEALNA